MKLTLVFFSFFSFFSFSDFLGFCMGIISEISKFVVDLNVKHDIFLRVISALVPQRVPPILGLVIPHY